MFRNSSNGTEGYTTSVTGFINKCNIRIELKARAAAFKERDTNPDAYKKSLYALRRTIKKAKGQYRARILSYYTGSSVVAGLENDYGLQKENQPRAAR
jgi:hypothetical protein